MSDDTSYGGSGLSAQNRVTIETLYRAFAGEPDLLDQAVTPGWQDIPLAPGQGPGPEGVKPMIRVLKGAFPDITITVHDVIAAGDLIAVRAEITGTHTGAWLGVPPSGRRFSVALHEFHRVENGRLTHTWHLEDWFGWLNQVGAWPSPKENAS